MLRPYGVGGTDFRWRGNDEAVWWEWGVGAGIGRDAGQALLAQPVLAGRQGDGGDRHGTQTV